MDLHLAVVGLSLALVVVLLLVWATHRSRNTRLRIIETQLVLRAPRCHCTLKAKSPQPKVRKSVIVTPPTPKKTELAELANDGVRQIVQYATREIDITDLQAALAAKGLM